MDWMMQPLLDWLTRAVFASLDTIFGWLTGGLLHNPDVTVVPQVQALAGRSVWIVDTIFVLAFIAAGITTMAGGASEKARYHIKDLAPRMVVGFIAAHFSQVICAKAISVANAVVAAIGADQVDPATGRGSLKTIISNAANPADSARLLVCILAILVMVLLAACAFAMIARLATLLVLAMVAPLALAGHALPATDPIARLWWRAFAGCLIIPVLQAFTLQAGMWTLQDSAHMFPMREQFADKGTIFNLLIVIVLLWITIKIPGLVRKYVTSGAGGQTTVIGGLLRVAVTSAALSAGPAGRAGVTAATTVAKGARP